MIMSTETSARKSDMSERAGKRRGHSGRLFSELSALRSPAHHDHGSIVAKFMREFSNPLSRNAALSFGPFGGFDDTVFFAEHISHKRLESLGAALNEIRIEPAALVQCMNHRKHQSAVGAREGRDPFTFEISAGLSPKRIHHDGFDAGGFKRFKLRIAVMKRGTPINIICNQRVAAP